MDAPSQIPRNEAHTYEDPRGQSGILVNREDVRRGSGRRECSNTCVVLDTKRGALPDGLALLVTPAARNQGVFFDPTTQAAINRDELTGRNAVILLRRAEEPNLQAYKGDFSIDWLQPLTGHKPSLILSTLAASAQRGWVKQKEPGVYALVDSGAHVYPDPTGPSVFPPERDGKT